MCLPGHLVIGVSLTSLNAEKSYRMAKPRAAEANCLTAVPHQTIPSNLQRLDTDSSEKSKFGLTKLLLDPIITTDAR